MGRFIRAGLAGAIDGGVKVFVVPVYCVWAVKLALIDSNIHPLFAMLMIGLSAYGLWIITNRITRRVTSIVSGEANYLNVDDAVYVKAGSPTGMRPGEKGRVVGIVPDELRMGPHVAKKQRGTVYLVEFADGELLDVHENVLERTSRKRPLSTHCGHSAHDPIENDEPLK
jgi:hypothetical protein